MTLDSCPCGSSRDFEKCCNRYIAGAKPAPIAEALMRSRYTAYCIGDISYILATWAEQTRHLVSEESLENRKSETEYLGLKILSKQAGTRKHTQGQVEFQVTFKHLGKSQTHHEQSNFVKINDKWFYVDGNVSIN
ncbi:MAG: YchJ family metal-binding protein [Hyphomicrobiales bacterium]